LASARAKKLRKKTLMKLTPDLKRLRSIVFKIDVATRLYISAKI